MRNGSRDVDIVIAVHETTRPVERAVRSVLEHNRADLMVTIVCHGIPAHAIAGRLQGFGDHARVRLIEFDDGVRSPAGPFNAGLDAAQARYVSIMGSDDELQPGAVDAWLRVATRDGADIVIARLRHGNGRFVLTPPTRPWRRRDLDGVRDRLSYRSAPLGLVSRERFGELRLTPGVSTGEDIAYVTALWFSGARISYASDGPAYLIHDDSDSRTSFSEREIGADLAFLSPLLSNPYVLELSVPAKYALAAKLWRVNIFGAVYNRRDHTMTPDERRALALAGQELLAYAPQAVDVLSIADRRLVTAVCSADTTDADLADLARRRRRFGRPAALVPSAIGAAFAREAPLRMMVASTLQKLGGG